MKKTILLLVVLFQLQVPVLVAQNTYIMGEQKLIITNSGMFYDDGGNKGNVGSKPLISTFQATSDLLEIYFTEFNIPFDAALIVYNGASINDPAFGVYRNGDKPWSFKGVAITIQYIPSPSNTQASGWKGVIQSTSSADILLPTMPESDCTFAIPLCSNSTINTSANQYSNTGNVNDDAGSCYSGTGSGGSVWYTFTPQTTGWLDFAIAPTGSTDYDFVLWDITNGCNNKVELSCNFSGTHGTTGINSSGTSNSEPASGPLWNQKITVNSANKYAICINYYAGVNDGFQLTFSNEPGDVSITDAVPPTITNAYANNCTNATQLHITFSEWVQCGTVIAANLTIPGRTIGIINNFCSGSKTNKVDISVSPALTTGTYTLTGLNILDMCGNPMNSTYNITLGVAPVPTLTPGGIICRTTNYIFGIPSGYSYSPSSSSLTANNTGGGFSSYIWSDGYVGATNVVSPASTTTYTVTVTNGGCTATLSTIVTIEPSPTPNLGPDITMCTGLPLSLSSSGGVSYQWQVQTGSTFFFNTPIFSNIPGATASAYSTVPVQYGSTGATYYQVIVTSANGCTGTDMVKIIFGAGVFSIAATNPYICQGGNVTLTVPGGITSYTWNTGTSPNAPLTVAPAVTTSYTVTSTTAACPGTAVITVPVRPLPVTIAAANPLTACAGTPVNLQGDPSPTISNITEEFEGVTQLFTLVNGTYNKWYHGTVAKCNGAKGLYIGTSAANNNYSVISGLLTSNAATNHAYKDVSVTSYCTANISFNWKCGGNANASLSVWLVPTTYTPVAGTAIVASATNILAGGPYFGGGAACNAVIINMLPYVGSSKRVVFSWSNTGGILAPTPVPPAAMIDDFLFTQGDSYSYNWTSTPAGFTSSFQNTIANPVAATVYNLTVTRCDGCASTSTIAIGPCLPLDVELLNFEGHCNQNQYIFNWTTASETNSDYFTVQKSKNGLDFTDAANIKAAGSSTAKLNYSLSLSDIGNEFHYFRLAETGIDGEKEFSSSIFVKCESEFYDRIILYPNPSKNIANLKFLFPVNAELHFQIKDVTGREINKIVHQVNTANNIELNIDNLLSGVYFIQIFDPLELLDFPILKLIKE